MLFLVNLEGGRASYSRTVGLDEGSTLNSRGETVFTQEDISDV